MKSIYIYGSSGHGLVVADIAFLLGYTDIIFIDDGENDFLAFEDIKNNHKNIPLAFGIGCNKTRRELFKKVRDSGISIITLIHPTAVVSKSAEIKQGTVIMPNVVVNAHAYIGQGVILNSGCVIEHENRIESFVHISPNVSLAGNVVVKELSHIGIGVSIIQNITIGKFCVIGAGSVVLTDIKDNTLAYGVPCKEIKDLCEQ